MKVVDAHRGAGMIREITSTIHIEQIRITLVHSYLIAGTPLEILNTTYRWKHTVIPLE